MDYYKETERRLYNYYNIEFAIERRNQQILKLLGPNKVKGVDYSKEGGITKEELINKYSNDIDMYESEIIDMRECLKSLSKDKDYKYLELIYRDRFSYQEIANIVNLDRSVVSRHKALIVNKLKIMLYPELIFDKDDI